MLILLLTALCDLGYTIYQHVTNEYGGVAQYLYFSPSVLAVTMVSMHSASLPVFKILPTISPLILYTIHLGKVC